MSKVAERSFVSALELPELKPELRQLAVTEPTPAVTDKASAKVNAGSITSFVAGVDAQSQSDVLNSTLLAQLNSDKVSDREADTIGWYKNYVHVLGKVGWVIQDFSFKDFQSSSQGLSMDKVVIEIIQSIMTGNELAVAKSAIDALSALSDDDNRIKLFSHSSSSDKGGAFQIATVTKQGGALAMNLGACYMSFSSSSTSVLWFHYKSSSVKIHKSGQGVTLNNDVYKEVRQPIITKLGDKAKQFVMDLDI